MRQSSGGFTLFETIVTVAIVGVLTVVVAVAFQTTRESQNLTLAQQQLQFMLRDAQKKALQEEREIGCLNQVLSEALKRTCSDIGLYLNGSTVTLFADIHRQDGLYSSDQDYVVNTLELPNKVALVGEPKSFLFRAKPPTITLWAQGGEVLEKTSFTLQSGRSTRQLWLYSYGHLETK